MNGFSRLSLEESWASILERGIIIGRLLQSTKSRCVCQKVIGDLQFMMLMQFPLIS
jgi:hypothetical protein